MATELISLFRQAKDTTRGELAVQLQVLEGEETDYRIKRGLAHLLSSALSTFEMMSPLDPAILRQRAFALSAQGVPSPQASERTLSTLAAALSHELERDISPAHIRAGLYADLPEHHLLTSFAEPTPEALIHRYNLSQAQGVLYRASHVTITAHRNDPGEYKLLFRYMKLFGLMAYIEGDADHGFTLTFRTGRDDDYITVTGILSHREGHSEETTMSLPVDMSGSKNAVQAVGSSTSYGKRYTTQALLNLTSRGEDDDGAAHGAITAEQKDEIIELIRKTNADTVKFIEHLGVGSIDEIPASQFQRAIKALEERARKRSAQ